MTKNAPFFWAEQFRFSIDGVQNGSAMREVAANPIDRMLWIDNRTYLPGDLLGKMDIASMHCGLEARSPLLDHEVIEYCASLPINMKVRGREVLTQEAH